MSKLEQLYVVLTPDNYMMRTIHGGVEVFRSEKAAKEAAREHCKVYRYGGKLNWKLEDYLLVEVVETSRKAVGK